MERSKLSMLVKESVYVKFTVSEHPTDQGVCTKNNHDTCNWEKTLKTGLGEMFPDINITALKCTNNVISFAVSYNNRSAQKSDIYDKLDWFLRYNQEVALKRVCMTQKQ